MDQASSPTAIVQRRLRRGIAALLCAVLVVGYALPAPGFAVPAPPVDDSQAAAATKAQQASVRPATYEPDTLPRGTIARSAVDGIRHSRSADCTTTAPSAALAPPTAPGLPLIEGPAPATAAIAPQPRLDTPRPYYAQAPPHPLR